MTQIAKDAAWPELRLAAWQDTYATLRLWTQIIGKVRFALHALAQSFLARDALRHGARARHRADPARRPRSSIDFDFLDHVLWLRTSDGHVRQIMLRPMLGRRILRAR